MAKPGKLKEISGNEPSETVLLRLLNEHQTITAVAKELNVSVPTAWGWVNRFGIERSYSWVQRKQSTKPA